MFGGEAGLVGVDVADAGDAALVEDDRLDGRLASRDGLGEHVDAEALAQRLRPQPGRRGLGEVVDQPEAAELAYVGEAQLGAVVQRQDGAQEAVRLGAGRPVQQRAGHAQVHDDQRAGIETQRQVLAAALDGLDARADHALAKRRLVDALEHGNGLTGIGGDCEAGDAPANDTRLEVAPYRLDFGELRHGKLSAFSF